MSDFKWAVEPHQIGLKIVGLWPKVNKVGTSSLASELCTGIAFVVNFLTVIPLLCALMRVWGDMSLMIDNLQILLPLLVISLKLVIMRCKKAGRLSVILDLPLYVSFLRFFFKPFFILHLHYWYNVKKYCIAFLFNQCISSLSINSYEIFLYFEVLSSVVRTMAEDWREPKNDVERDVMMRQAQIARMIVIFGSVLMMLALTSLIVLPSLGLPFRHVTNLTDRNRVLPLPAYYYYDTDKSPQFELTFAMQAVTMFYAAVVYMSVDAFLGLVVFHMRGQLENFRHRLTNLFLCTDFDSALRKNVETHLRLIRFL